MTHRKMLGLNTGRVWRAGFAVGIVLASLSRVQGEPSKPRDLTEFSLEELMSLQVTSVTAKEQKLSRAAAAVYVITADDIRRSGAENIPDLLRIVPGVDVEQIDANAWAVSIRGFADRTANKVLVLVDGRSIYNPVYSGVMWDAVDVPLEDIDRIEVIRGPGGTVWGANAVNGVINILTKSARSTQGGLLTVRTGTEQIAGGLVRYGGTIGPKGAYRIFGRYFDIDNSDSAVSAGPAHDGWYVAHGGFRSDWNLSERDSLTIQGDFQRTLAGQTLPVVFSNALPLTAILNDRIGMSTANVLGHWKHTLANGSETSLQIYDDVFRRSEQGVQYSHNIVDVAFQHHVAVSSRHDVVWGGGARQASTRFIPGYALAVYPERKTDRLYSAFVQDEIKMTNTAWLTVGSKFEHNDYTGFEFEPSAQVLWTPAEEHTVWFSAARAIRQPSRIDAGIQYDTAVVPGSPLLVMATTGNPNLKAERLYDIEAGYRGILSRQFSLDLAVFGGWYRDLVAPVPQAPVFTTYPAPPHLFMPVQFQNAASAHTYGAELFLNANVTHRWRVSPGYSRIRLTIEPNAGVTSNGQSLLRPNTPENQFQFRSFLNLPHNLEWDQTLGYVGAITHQSVPSYVRLDTRFGWRMGESWEFSVTGQNLLRPRHVEVPDEYGLNRVEIQRSVFAKVCWRF